MSRNFPGPIKAQNPKPPVGRRRVFVQTETGGVLCLDLDRNDNAHTVKRRLQVVFNVPTEESSLSFGDQVLENDLTSVRGESPLLLTRNTMHRSCSTPCLNPNSHLNPNLIGDTSRVVEILGFSSGRPDKLAQLVRELVRAIKLGIDPVPVNSGLGGSYYFRNTNGNNLAIIKPTDEEPFAPNNPKGFVGKSLGQPGLKRSVRVGETGFREVAAYLLDHGNFANVPPTCLVKITHSVFHINGGVQLGNMSKIASLQEFVKHDYDASDYGTYSFPVRAVHSIGILDVRIFNTDRHGGNVLVRKVGGTGTEFGGLTLTDLVPIDHGLCLPESLEDPYFEWIHWPQASIPFSDEELRYIYDLDPEKDAKLLRDELPMIREACLRVLVLCTNFLKMAAELGFCLKEIGEMMSREFKGVEEEPSELELVCMEAKRAIWESERNGDDDVRFKEDDVSGFQFEMDVEESNGFGLTVNGSKKVLPKLEESIEECDEELGEMNFKQVGFGRNLNGFNSNVSILSKSLKGVYITEKPALLSEFGGNCNGNPNSNLSGANRSANEHFPSSTCFVRLGDMSKEEWGLFIEKFKDLARGNLRERKKAGSACQWQRLGTSCKF
ncbi:hypothetical protein LUZ60_002161 [Juncus effusus]|nr:hypothetical protein LUZ60_002161 [Juncus effusus]